jgi:lantibiotic leader peptide-processing serine protease
MAHWSETGGPQVRKVLVGTLLTVLVSALTIPAHAGPTTPQQEQKSTEYVVLYDQAAGVGAARAAVTAAGGTIVRENTAVGVATVRSTRSNFAAVARQQGAIDGVAHNRVIGWAPKTVGRGLKRNDAEKAVRAEARAATTAQASSEPGAEPLAGLQWDMQQIDATISGSYSVERGDKRVKVGIMDTGIDGSHPDIAPNFDRVLSRNFTVDIPKDADGREIDGPCGAEPDHSCNDPADVDEDGHGTHVASTIGSPINGLGIAGVAPNVSLVNIRAGQDSGFFFLQPTVDAFTYAGNMGLDVVNMSFFTDPWLFNCTNNPADTPAERAEQVTIREATQRAADYARARGVTLIAAAGNQAIDVTKPSVDTTSPDFDSVKGKGGEPKRRDIDPATCDTVPAETNGVIAVSSLGISKRKAYYSSFGNGFVDVSAPGGDVYDTADKKRDVTKAVLAAFPTSLTKGLVDSKGVPKVDFLVRDCQHGTCAYYQYLQGTSMASPHAVGVAALIVSKFGVRDTIRGGLTLPPAATETVLRATAVNTPCPTPPLFHYERLVLQRDGTFLLVTANHLCEGTADRNGFYGDGIVNAQRAVTLPVS